MMNACASTSYTDDLSNYLTSDVPLLFAEQMIFPDKQWLTDESVNLYTAESKSTLMYDDMYFLLDCTYSEIEYINEIKRIADCGAIYREDLFQFPAYIMLFAGSCYEYVLLNESDNQLIYVYAQTADWKVFNHFPERYVPIASVVMEICQYEN